MIHVLMSCPIKLPFMPDPREREEPWNQESVNFSHGSTPLGVKSASEGSVNSQIGRRCGAKRDDQNHSFAVKTTARRIGANLVTRQLLHLSGEIIAKFLSLGGAIQRRGRRNYLFLWRNFPRPLRW